jgi:hypothetical protein
VEEAGREAVSTTTFCDGGGNGEPLDMMTEERRSPEPSLQVLPGFLVVSVPFFRPRNLESPNQHSISSELNSLDRREGRQTGWLAGGRVSVWMIEEMRCGHEKVMRFQGWPTSSGPELWLLSRPNQRHPKKGLPAPGSTSAITGWKVEA